MSFERTRRAEDLFHAALERDAVARRTFVESECGPDRALADEVLSLLAARDDDSRYLDEPAFATPAQRARPPSEGERLGAYRLVRELASGGMGAVWLAERVDGEYRANVAIKLVHGALLSGPRRAEILRRFAEERQTLANLDHPHIARLYDGGTANDGSPFLVMEYIDGQPIDRYCAEHELTLDERLELFRRVCLAVQHAHSKLVAHRDLKPGNILVREAAENGGAPEPKLLDFGIAKLFDGADAGSARTTQGSSRLTPAYASPEQFRGEPASAATDVWSLGVILFELLTGRLPFAIAECAPHVIAQRVLTSPPARASEIDPRLSGDLDTILAKALEKEPARRYASAAALAEDIERHLTNHPILARPSTAAERFVKTVRRHKLPFALAAGLFVSVSALSVWLSMLNTRSVHAEELADSRRIDAERAQKQADDRRAQAERTADLFREIFASPDPYKDKGKDVKVVDVLDEAAPRVLAGLESQPEVRTRLAMLVGETYRNLGELEKAIANLTIARDALLARSGPEDIDTLTAESNLSTAEFRLGRREEAEQRSAKVVAIARRVFGEKDEQVLVFKSNWSAMLRDLKRLPEAEALQRECLAVVSERTGAASRRTVVEMNNLATILSDQGHWRDAEDMLRKALEIAATFEQRDVEVELHVRSSLGRVLRELGQLPEASELLRGTYDAKLALLGPEHPDTLETMGQLAALLLDLGQLDEAEALLTKLAEVQTRRLGADNPSTLETQGELASALEGRGKFDEAEALVDRSLELARNAHGEDHWISLVLFNHRMLIALNRGDLPLAESRAREVLELLRRVLGDTHRDTLNAINSLAVILHREQKSADAEPLFRELLTAQESALGEDAPETFQTRHNLALALQAQGKLDEAEALLRDLVERASRTLDDTNYSLAWFRASLGKTLAAQKSFDEAERVMLRSLEGFEASLGPAHPRTQRHVSELADLYAAWGKPDEARRYRERAQTPEKP